LAYSLFGCWRCSLYFHRMPLCILSMIWG
jgi:hypothetical protein